MEKFTTNPVYRMLLIPLFAFALTFGAVAVTSAPETAEASSAPWICQTKYAQYYDHCKPQTYADKVDIWAGQFAAGRNATGSIYNFVAGAKYSDSQDGGTRNADMCATAASMVGNGPGYPQVYTTLQQANLFYVTGVAC